MKEEIKDIQYFIKKEKEYISEHKNDGSMFEEGIGVSPKTQLQAYTLKHTIS